MFTVTERWKSLYPGASVGVLAMNAVANPTGHIEVEHRKQELENELRTNFAGFDRNRLKALEVIKAYEAYYGKFNKSYHVLSQLESIAFKGKHLPSAGSLVDNMFVAELRNKLLTAGHDLDSVVLPLKIDAAEGTESYTMYNGKLQMLKMNDMFICDSIGVISSILYGPDQRTRIKSDTKHVLFTVYAPQGIRSLAVRAHLDEIRAGAIAVAPEASVELLEVFEAN